MTDQPDSREVLDGLDYLTCGCGCPCCERAENTGREVTVAFTRYLATTAARVAELEAALLAIVESDVPRPLGVSYRADKARSKHDQCIHHIRMHDDCGNCIADFATAALAH